MQLRLHNLNFDDLLLRDGFRIRPAGLTSERTMAGGVEDSRCANAGMHVENPSGGGSEGHYRLQFGRDPDIAVF